MWKLKWDVWKGFEEEEEELCFYLSGTSWVWQC